MQLIESKSNKFYHFYPNIVTVVATRFENKINLMPVAWNSGVSSNPRYFAVMIAKKRYTYELIKKSQKFSANFLSWDYLKLVDNIGSVSGREVDKISKFNIPVQEGRNDGIVILPISYAVYECKVVKDEEIGDHNLIIGEVLTVHINPDVFDENERPILNKVSPIFYFGKNRYVKLVPSEEVEFE